MKPVALIAALVSLAACVSPQPTVSERNSAGISIQTAPGVAPPIAITSAQNMASRYCSGAGKRAEYSDTRQLRDGTAEHYFMCL